LQLRGELDEDALERALRAIVERHEILRTVYRVEGREAVQVPLEEWALDVKRVDLRDLDGEARTVELTRYLRDAAREPFDLAADLMFRASIVRLDEDDFVLLLRLHHIAYDAFSDNAMFGDLEELYTAFRDGREPSLQAAALQYADFAVWQRERLQGDVLERLISYWREALADVPDVLALPLDRPRPAVKMHDGVHRYVDYPKEAADALAEVSRAEGATLYMGLLACFATLLYRVTGDDDVAIGTPIANRNRVELEPLIGFFTNTVVMRNRLHGNPTFREVIRRTREMAIGAYAHQELPFDKIVDALKVPRNPSYNPVFQVNFRAQTGARRLPVLPGLSVSTLAVDIGFARFDLALELQVDTDRVGGYFEYDTALFDAATAEALVEDFGALLSAVATQPDTPVLDLRLPHGRRKRPVRARRGPQRAVADARSSA
jgi:Condensation domain